MKVAEILRSKGNKVVTVQPSETILSLAHKLRFEKIGAAVVSKDGMTIDGIISERDVIKGLVEYRDELLTKSVSNLMTRSVVTANADDSIRDVMNIMTRKRIRHLPVTDGNQLLGIISVGDIVKHRLNEMQLETNVLRDYAVARH